MLLNELFERELARVIWRHKTLEKPIGAGKKLRRLLSAHTGWSREFSFNMRTNMSSTAETIAKIEYPPQLRWILERALNDSDDFWGEIADDLYWFRRWDKVSALACPENGVKW
jgi:hypothetical protein